MKIIITLIVIYTSVFFISAGVCQNQKVIEAPLILPNISEEMLHPEFWINRLVNPDKIIMTPEQIAEMNTKNRSRSIVIKDINGDPFSIEKTIRYKDQSIGAMYHTEDPFGMTSFPGDSLRARFENHKQLFNRDLYDRRRVKYSEYAKQIVIDRMNEEHIPQTINPRYGLIVKRTLNRAMPMNEAAYPGENAWLDYMQSTGLETGMPVAVLHMSTDKDWYYVRSDISFGWVPALHVAFATTEALKNYINTKDFIVAVDHKIPVYTDPAFNNFLTEFYMGARLKLTGYSGDGFIISVPVRSFDGSLDLVPGYVKPDAAVNIGYQQYTQRNIITTMFRLLNRPLGWADSDYERDCCGTIRAVHKTFGIITGRWVTYIIHATNHVFAFPVDTPIERKYKILDSCEPGICVIGNEWHIMMYLGKIDGKYYVIQQNGLDYKTDDDTIMQVRRVCVNETESGPNFPATMWTEISEIKP
ncbi:MAG: SH3 domain-containing protein [Candidatus Latescibacteria bacterium]|nr:SH3 domain-containing protein [Candidatus Latescibacterota bacterium]